MGWHLKGAQFKEPETPRATIRGIELINAKLRPMGVARDINEQVAKDAVHQPGRTLAPLWRLLKGDL
jgi:hypothetical protein